MEVTPFRSRPLQTSATTNHLIIAILVALDLCPCRVQPLEFGTSSDLIIPDLCSLLQENSFVLSFQDLYSIAGKVALGSLRFSQQCVVQETHESVALFVSAEGGSSWLGCASARALGSARESCQGSGANLGATGSQQCQRYEESSQPQETHDC
jgi:hypothetical protein